MSICTRCGTEFGCAMADKLDAPCWCTELPPVAPLAPVPDLAPACWCPACLRRHVDAQAGNAGEPEKY